MSSGSEMDKEKSSLWGVSMVALAVMLRFLHSVIQKQLSTVVFDHYKDASPAVITFIISCVQIIAAMSIIRVRHLNFRSSPVNLEAMIIGVLAYFGGQFLDNYLLWGKESPASAGIGLQEPLVCVILLYSAARIYTQTYKVGAVVCVCLGGALLTTDFTLCGHTSSILRVLASVFLLVRNVVTKLLYDSSVSFIPRGLNTIITITACGTIVALAVSLLFAPQGMAPMLVAMLLTVIAAVLLSVASLHLLFMLLLLYDTLTVAIFMLWAQILENVMVMGDVTHPGAISAILGTVLFAAGHYAYFKDGLELGTIHLNIKQVGVNELLTRLQFILYACSIVGLTVSILKPFVSERDMDVLSYIGLDRIARKLLNSHPGER